MKRILITLISLMLALSLIGCSFGKTDPDDTVDPEPAPSDESDKAEFTEEQLSSVSRLLEKWEEYLSVSEQMYGAELWALDYVDGYLKTDSWQDLSHARTACINAAAFQNNMFSEIEDLAEEDYNTLLLIGLDTSYQSNEFSMAKLMLEDSHDRLRDNLLYSLQENIFYKNGFELLRSYADIYRKLVKNYCSYDCALINYQISDLESHGYTDETIRIKLTEKYPTVFSSGYQWQSSTEGCLTKADEILDENEELTGLLSDAVSQNAADLYLFKDAVKNGAAVEYLLNEMNVIDGLPDAFPAPDWYNSASALYATMKITDDNNVIHQDVGTELGDEIFTNVMLVSDVSFDTCLEYISDLEELGFPNLELSDGSVGVVSLDYYAVFSKHDDGLMITFETQDVTFVPIWYYGLLK